MHMLRTSLLAFLIASTGFCTVSVNAGLLEEEDKQTEKPGQNSKPPVMETSSPEKVSKSELQARARRAGISTKVWLDVLKYQPLTKTQKDQITKIVRGYMENVRNWEKTFGKKLSTLQKEIRSLRAEDKDIPDQVREQMTKLRGERPRPWGMQKKVWDVMTERQQKVFREDLDLSKANGFAMPRTSTTRKTRKNDGVEERSLPTPKASENKPENTSAENGDKKPAGGKKTDGKSKVEKPWSFIN